MQAAACHTSKHCLAQGLSTPLGLLSAAVVRKQPAALHAGLEVPVAVAAQGCQSAWGQHHEKEQQWQQQQHPSLVVERHLADCYFAAVHAAAAAAAAAAGLVEAHHAEPDLALVAAAAAAAVALEHTMKAAALPLEHLACQCQQ